MLAHTGMLSWSSETTNTLVDVRAVTDPTVDPLIPGGVALLRYADAVVAQSTEEIRTTGETLGGDLGPAGLVDAAAVVGNFQMMNRVADGTGIPVDRGMRIRNAELIELLDLDRLDHTKGVGDR